MLDTIPRYLFNAKELDEESGLYYYEARYYSDENIMFTARDPLFEKYFWLSPYNYCGNNPVKYIDPTGMEVINEYEAAYKKAENRVNDAQKAFDAFGRDKKADGYKDAKKELRQAKKELSGITPNYVQTQSAITDLKKYNLDLFNQLDALDDENGNRVNVYVGINKEMSQRGTFNCGFDEDVQQFYSMVNGVKVYNSVKINLNPGTLEKPNDLGEILSHEGGHGTYTVINTRSYNTWRVFNCPNPGDCDGHNKNDPSGEEAYKQQRIYCRNKGIMMSY
jgi:RHS repeat-associated protein